MTTYTEAIQGLKKDADRYQFLKKSHLKHLPGLKNVTSLGIDIIVDEAMQYGIGVEEAIEQAIDKAIEGEKCND